MVKEVKYTNIRRVLDELTEHPMLRDLTLEQVVRYVVEFIEINGFPCLFEDKIEAVDIKDYKGVLPCDLISIRQVRDYYTKVGLRAMSDLFTPGMTPKDDYYDRYMKSHNTIKVMGEYIPPMNIPHGELAFKTQGRIIYTSFPEGKIEIAYQAMPVDDEGFPLLIDNSNYIKALKEYIKKERFQIKYEQGNLAAGVLEKVEQRYAFLAGQLNNEMVLPSMSEMESMTRQLNTLVRGVRHFDNGFKDLGNREYIRRH